MLVGQTNRSHAPRRGGMMGYGSLGAVRMRGGVTEEEAKQMISQAGEEAMRRQAIDTEMGTSHPMWGPPIQALPAALSPIPPPRQSVKRSTIMPGAKFLRELIVGYLDQGVPSDQVAKKTANVWYDSAIAVGLQPTVEQYDKVVNKASLQLGKVLTTRKERLQQAEARLERRTQTKTAKANVRLARKTVPKELSSKKALEAKTAIQDIKRFTVPEALAIVSVRNRTKAKA